jgi:hypothetical protein
VEVAAVVATVATTMLHLLVAVVAVQEELDQAVTAEATDSKES